MLVFTTVEYKTKTKVFKMYFSLKNKLARYPAFKLAGYPAKFVSGASLT